MARLYGVTHVSSHGTVTHGFARALESVGKLDGLVDLTQIPSDDDEPVGGALARDAVFTGSLDRMGVMACNARHDRRYAMVAPNSTVIPKRLIEDLERQATHILAPSTWAYHVLRAQCPALPVLVAPHGVSHDLQPYSAQPCRQDYEAGGFKVFHFSTSNGERKATRELVQAWQRVHADLGPGARLYCVLNNPTSLQWVGLDDHRTNVSLCDRNDHSEAVFAAHMAHIHLVAQPSRGEGFGLVPLEARAAGCPVLMTDCTGHSEHAGTSEDGCVVVPSGPYAEIDDGPGAEAPTVRVDDIAQALLEAHRNWKKLKENALARAELVRRNWSWEKKLATILPLLH